MATVHLSVEPVLWGPMSFGTVELIKVVRARFGLQLGEAKAFIDRCVFEGEVVSFAVPIEEAKAFAREVGGLKSPAKFHVWVET